MTAEDIDLVQFKVWKTIGRLIWDRGTIIDSRHRRSIVDNVMRPVHNIAKETVYASVAQRIKRYPDF